MKLAREEVPFVRLGRPSGVHPAVRPWVPGGERYPQKTTRELARLAESVPVVSGSWGEGLQAGVGLLCLPASCWRQLSIDSAGCCARLTVAALPSCHLPAMPRSLAPLALACTTRC